METLAESEIVIIGGGAIGCGVAYSLARAGKTDVLLVERAGDVGQVTTAQGAGLCGQVRSSVDRVRLAMHSVETFRELQRDAETRPDWHEVGSIRIAFSPPRVEELRRLQAVCEQAGLEVTLLDRAEAERLWPPMDLSAAEAVLWCPSDGYMTPTAVTKAYESRCRRMGVRFEMGTAVTGITVREGRVVAVQTDQGEIRCRIVIDAAGAHAYHVARLVGLELPIVPVRHEYYDTAPLPGLRPGPALLPHPRDDDLRSRRRGVSAARRLGSDGPQHRPAQLSAGGGPAHRRDRSRGARRLREAIHADLPRGRGARIGSTSAKAGRHSRPTAGSSSVRAAASRGS